jgi:hypothetical protein
MPLMGPYDHESGRHFTLPNRQRGYGGIGLLYALLLALLRKQAIQAQPGLFETALAEPFIS